MKILCDTNVIARSMEPGHAQYSIACAAISELKPQGNELCVCPQVFFELWSVATRPVDKNGLGRSFAEAHAMLVQSQALFTLIPETSAVVTEWEDLIVKHSVMGKNSHDAHLVASMTVNGVLHLLTFNVQDFVRFSFLTLINPASVQKLP